MLDVSLIVVPVSLTSTASIASANHSYDTRTLSFDGSQDVAAKDDIIHAEVLAHNISTLKPGVGEVQSLQESGGSTPQPLGVDERSVPFLVQKSHTFHGLHTIEQTPSRPNRRVHDKGPSSVGDKVLKGIRRSRTFFDWGRLKFDRLEDRIKGAVEESIFSHQKNFFLPQGQLLKFVTQGSVEGELSRWKHITVRKWKTYRVPSGVQIEAQTSPAGKTPARSQSESILPQDWGKTYRNIFAILLLVNRPSSIWSFVEEGICDADLPLIKVPRAEGPQHLFDLRRRNDAELPLRCFKQWKDRAIVKFEERQWFILAPSFEKSDGKEIPHREFATEEILPFLSWKATSEEGGFGQVYEVNIHPDHHAFNKTEVRTPTYCCYQWSANSPRYLGSE